MKLENNTVLITGGSSGIGLELAKVLVAKNNKVLICGRNLEKLTQAKAQIPEIEFFQCDISKPDESEKLAKWVKDTYPACNNLINNAAIVNKIDFFDDKKSIELAEIEYETNLLAPIRLIKLLYPTLKTHNSSVIINITTGLIYAPRVIYPFYNSSKSALHSFTQTLRIRLKNEKTEVFEVMFPAVDTPWHQGKPPKIAISTQSAVSEMIKGLEKGKPEIRVRGAKILYKVSRLAPGFALKKINSLE